MRHTLIALFILLAIGMSSAVAADHDAPFAFKLNEQAGTLTVRDSDQPVLSVVYKPRLEAGVAEEYRRAGYLHPVFDLQGRPITQDFPADHYHHRGVWLSWPWMQYEGQTMQLWHPAVLKQRFAGWDQREVEDNRAILAFRNNWQLDGERVIGHESWRVVVHPENAHHRVIDLQLTVAAHHKPIKLRGKQNARKGYGGLAVRTAADLKQGRLLTNAGPLTKDAVQKHFQWADLANDRRGLAVFAHPDNPNSPPPWLLRNSYGGVLNPEWPGLKTVTLKPDQPVTLRYRLFIHDGQPTRQTIADAYQQWVQAQ
jgi:hypothetical protein